LGHRPEPDTAPVPVILHHFWGTDTKGAFELALRRLALVRSRWGRPGGRTAQSVAGSDPSNARLRRQLYVAGVLGRKSRLPGRRHIRRRSARGHPWTVDCVRHVTGVAESPLTASPHPGERTLRPVARCHRRRRKHPQ